MEGDRRKLGKGEKGREGENEGVCAWVCVCVFAIVFEVLSSARACMHVHAR
jgi:hypothetical protein